MHIEYNVVVDFQGFRDDNFRNDEYPQRQEISVAQFFCGKIAQNFTEMMSS